MKVILTQDVKGKGKRGQCLEISDGYARNYLLPRKLAVLANADNLNTMNMNDKALAEKQAKERAIAMDLSHKLKETVVNVTAKGGGAGRLFGSITVAEIAQCLKEQHGITLDRRKMALNEPIKNVGTYTVRCKLGYDIVGELTAKVAEA